MFPSSIPQKTGKPAQPRTTFLETSMNKLFLAMACLLATTATNAQTILGTWQGTLPIPENPRIILKLVKAQDGAPRGSFYWIDKFADPIPLSSVSFTAPNLNIDSLYVGASYQAKLSEDGKSLTGTWTQDKKTYPLTLQLTSVENVWKHPSPVAPLPWMSETTDPAFEVATIKPSASGATQRSYTLRTRHFASKNTTVADLIKLTYKVRARQIEGAPDWFDKLRFDIAAEPDTEGQPSIDQYRTMLKKLLADRFQLKLHIVQKIFPVYALTVEKAPPKLEPSETNVNRRGDIIVGERDGQMYAQFLDDSMPEFADILMNFIPERQIVDETGLKGRYDFSINMPTSVLQSTDDNEQAAGFFGALQTLGLKLTPKKEPIEVLVIDHLETPSPN